MSSKVKQLIGAAVGGLVGWKAADHFGSETWHEVVGAGVGAAAGWVIAGKV